MTHAKHTPGRKKPQPDKDSATLSIRIWTEPGGTLPEDLPEALESDVEHVQRLLGEGYLAGEICNEAFSGWWDLSRDDPARARLIAAAPELLAALQAALAVMNEPPGFLTTASRNVAHAARVAIAKATGGDL